jgi:integrase
MPKVEFTEAVVAQLAPPAKGKQLDYLDTVIRGLVLRVNYGGAKVWRASYRTKAKTKTGKSITIQTAWRLGVWPSMSVQAAREAATLFRADPQKAKAQKARAAGGASFEEVWQNFKKRHVDANHLRSGREITRCMDKYILPTLGPKRFRDLPLEDITELTDRIEDDHGRAQARRCFCHIRALCNWYGGRNGDYTSPIKHGVKGPRNSEERERFLDDAELKAVWRIAGELAVFGAFVKTCLLTAQRRGDILRMTREQLKGNALVIPSPELGKPKGTGGELVLPKMVRDLLASLEPHADNERVFASVGPLYRGKRDLDNRLAKALGRPVKRFTIHDLRRTAKTLMSRAGVLPHVSEKVLGHSLKGMEKVYDQYDWTPEKADALKRLAGLVVGIVGQEAPSTAERKLRLRLA